MLTKVRLKACQSKWIFNKIMKSLSINVDIWLSINVVYECPLLKVENFGSVYYVF